MIEFYDIIDSVRRQYAKSSSDIEKKFGLTNLEYNVIMFLADNPGCDTATSMIERRDLAKSHVSMAVCSLSKKKYIVGFKEKNDRRTVHLKLTDKAQAVIEEGHAAQLEFMNVALDGFTDEEKVKLFSDVEKIRKNLKAN